MKGAGTLLLGLFLGICFAPHCGASTNFYVDSDWTGAHIGTPSQPFALLDATAWASINAALASDNVTIFFSAREAGSNTPDYYDTAGNGVQLEIDLTRKTTSGPHWLTLDGKSFYNTNDSSPSWAGYAGASMCVVRDFNTQNPSHTKYSNITIHGFTIICNASTKLVTICGDNFVVENCDASHTSAALDGPGILLVPTADGAHEGSSYYAPPCTNITIQNNVIHDTEGEAIYLGGGSNPGEAGSGYPSHTNVSVLNNEIYNAGRYGGQGDGIDIKGGIQGLVVRGNNIHDIAYADQGARGIVSQGQPSPAPSGVLQTYERNNLHSLTHATEAITIADTWGVPAGVVIRNNIINTVTGGSGSKTGIAIYSSQNQLLVQNNIIYNCAGLGIGTATGSNILLRNNFLFANNSGGNQVDMSHGTIASDYNAGSPSWGFGSEGAHSMTLTAPQALAAVLDAPRGNFHLSASSPLIALAQTQSGFSNDYDNLTRTSPWDIGPYKLVATATPTATPTPTPTSTPTPTPTATSTPTATPAPSRCTVPNFIGVRLRSATILWEQAGFRPANITIRGGRGQRITWQSLPAGSFADCATATITVGP
jgi:hypothetical protein